MRTDSVTIDINASCQAIFELLHDYGRRLCWDPFLRQASLLGGASSAGPGVASRCVARWGAGGQAMETVYVSFTAPRLAAVRMTRGPIFLRFFAASIRQHELGGNRTRVTYRYRFAARPGMLARVIEPVVARVFRRETKRRLAALKEFMERGSPAADGGVVAVNCEKSLAR